jgi:lipoyl(octanoyl) transferase
MARGLAIHRLGTVPYGEALALQERLVEARLAGHVGDTLLLLEHPPVVTLGRGAKREHVRFGEEALRSRGVELFDTGRGGDVTYHAPGQLVGYPIVDLAPDRQDVRRYVADLEEVMLRVAAEYGLTGRRIPGLNGAWIGDRKIGAVGVRIRRWVTMHGFAFNVTTDLDGYEAIVPCGIPDKDVTSLARELDRPVPTAEVESRIGHAFADVFGASATWHDGPPLT